MNSFKKYQKSKNSNKQYKERDNGKAIPNRYKVLNKIIPQIKTYIHLNKMYWN